MNDAGNLVARGGDSFGYDRANRLITTTVGGITSTYTYDGDGKRITRTVGLSSTAYVYDVNRSLPVVIDDGSRKYVWGVGLAWAVDSSGNAYVYYSDGLGSVRAVADITGTIVQTYRTDEFGVPILTQGVLDQPFEYTGEQRDGETGLVYLRARMYESGTGRFVGVDPLPGSKEEPASLNRYTYVGNNPANAVDPSGLELSRILKGRESTNNECFKSAAGASAFYVTCFSMGALAQQVIYVVAPRGLIPVLMISPASPEPDDTVGDILKQKKGSIKNARLPKGSPAWEQILKMTWRQIEDAAKERRPGYQAIRKLLTNNRFDK